jgi:hypothetical protein
MSEKLLPCPNPSCKDSQPVLDDSTYGQPQIHCVHCGVFGPDADGESKAIRLWNDLPRRDRRPTPKSNAGLVEAIEKIKAIETDWRYSDSHRQGYYAAKMEILSLLASIQGKEGGGA